MLFKKAIRAVWANKRSYLACVFLIGIGIMMFTAMNIAGDGLEFAMLKFYEDYRLADVFAKVDAMPVNATDTFTEIEGIKAAEARYVFETRVEVPGSDEIITLRLISVDTQTDEMINDLLVTGSFLTEENDIMVNKVFFDAHGLNIGDSISVFVSGKEYIYNVCATAMGPEYAYITKSATDIMPDEKGFGIAYMTADSMSALTNSAGTANDVVFLLEDGYAFDNVKISLEDALAPYGLNELYYKEDLLSYAFLDQEVTGIKSVATAMPTVFMLMAVVVLYLMMKRVIEQERTQIGTLKAFGYSNAQIMLHYLCYGGITGIAGCAFGYIYGYLLSGFYFNMFLQFFMLPSVSTGFDPKYLAGALFMAVGGGLAGAFMGAYKVLGMNPAEAMRPESPRPVKYDIVGKIKALQYVLTSRGSMALRSIARNPVRSGFVVIGIVFSFGLLTISGSFTSLIDKMIYGQFTDIRRYNVKISLKTSIDYNEAVENAYAIDYVTRAEGLLEIPVELKNKNLKEGIVIIGIASDSVLYKISDTNTHISYPPPSGGLILSNGIADKLNAKAGDLIYVSSPLRDEDIPIYVTRVVEQNLGSACYMEIGALSELFDQPKTATAIILNTDNLAYLKDYLKSSSNAYSIEDKDSTLKSYQDMMEPFTAIYYILQIMCVLVAFAIVYNTSTISLSERKREYATLRVIGLSVEEVCEIMGFEYWVLSVVGMLFGIPFALYLSNAVNTMMDTSLYTMPSTLPAIAYITGVAGCAAAIILSNRSAKKKIEKFDMVEVLKERE